MNRKQRQYRRAVANKEIYIPKRKASMPSPKVIPLKHKQKREKEVLRSFDIYR